MPGTWRFTFSREDALISLEKSGVTPCDAKDKAYIELEALLKLFSITERNGWKLTQIEPIF